MYNIEHQNIAESSLALIIKKKKKGAARGDFTLAQKFVALSAGVRTFITRYLQCDSIFTLSIAVIIYHYGG